MSLCQPATSRVCPCDSCHLLPSHVWIDFCSFPPDSFLKSWSDCSRGSSGDEGDVIMAERAEFTACEASSIAYSDASSNSDHMLPYTPPGVGVHDSVRTLFPPLLGTFLIFLVKDSLYFLLRTPS